MKRSLLAILVLLSTTAVFADSAPKPDYSRDTILKILHDKDETEKPFKLNIGSIDINTKSIRYHLNYLPFLASIPYAGPHGASMLPNPFVLTNTEYAWRAHQYRADMPDFDDPEYSTEYRRTMKEIRRQHVVVVTR